MSQNITRVNTTQRKQAEAHEREAAVNEIENELNLLTESHQETRDRLKSLKSSKADLRKRKSSSKAESNSSGRIQTNPSSSSAKAKKATMAAKFGSKKCMLLSYCFVRVCFSPYFNYDTSRNQVKEGFFIVDWQLDC